ncbi:MAG TPA: glycoside hydrolase family 2, partial [Beijerinckiaceae bacterium]|nr:glycoside hydrolase family 2 [Beijerinckiaceae bacterium]
SLVVARSHNEAIAAHVRNGASFLLLPKREQSLYPFFPHWQNVRVNERRNTLWAGDWASSFAWMRRSGQFRRLPSGPLLDETFDRVIPEHVISGCNLLDFQARVFAGLVVGWIHKPVALGVERSYGRGRMVASTLRLFRDAPGADPTATILIDSLTELATESRASRIEEALRAAEAAA